MQLVGEVPLGVLGLAQVFGVRRVECMREAAVGDRQAEVVGTAMEEEVFEEEAVVAEKDLVVVLRR